jgi:hypothetical protein
MIKLINLQLSPSSFYFLSLRLFSPDPILKHPPSVFFILGWDTYISIFSINHSALSYSCGNFRFEVQDCKCHSGKCISLWTVCLKDHSGPPANTSLLKILLYECETKQIDLECTRIFGSNLGRDVAILSEFNDGFRLSFQANAIIYSASAAFTHVHDDISYLLIHAAEVASLL